jgi:hypothetical protein
VNEFGIQTDSDKVAAVQKFPTPSNAKELKRFLGMVSWYRRFIPNVANITAPLQSMLKKSARWDWTEAQQNAFSQLKKCLVEAPILAYPDWTKPFTLQTDASLEGLGAVLTQNDGEGERVIAYASRSLSKAEKGYSVTELECLAVKWAIWKMRDYLEGNRFTVLTDQQALKWLNSIDNPTGRLARWAFELSQYDFDIQYRKGSENNIADALSRNPVDIGMISEVKDDKWYARTFKAVSEEPQNYPDFQIKDQRLFKKILHTLEFNELEPGEEWKICVKEDEKQRVLEENHNIPTAGHLGIAKTLVRLSKKFYWPGMFREAKQYVRACSNCQKFKTTQQAPAGELHATNAGGPWELVSIDLVGPLPRSNNGFTQMIVMQDVFTKWIELRPIRKATATAIVKAVQEQILLRFGCPKTISTDNGRQFVSHEFKKLLESAKIKHRLTPPYSPQCNAVERANRTVKTMIKQYITGSQKNWDAHISEIAFAFNTAHSESTGYTPAYLNFSRELHSAGTLEQEARRGVKTSMENRIKNLQEALDLAKVNIAKSF